MALRNSLYRLAWPPELLRSLVAIELPTDSCAKMVSAVEKDREPSLHNGERQVDSELRNGVGGCLGRGVYEPGLLG